MKEQGFEDEFDEIDEIAKFVPSIYRWQASRYMSLFPNEEGDAHIGRMAVRKLYRGQHLGTKISDGRRKRHSSRMDLRPAPYQRKYRQKHSTNLLAIRQKARNTLMKAVHM